MRVLLSLLLLLTACGPQIESGTITGKEYIAAHMENYSATEYGCGFGYDPADGSYDYGCGRMISVTRQRWVADAWYITFERCDNGEDCRTRTLSVDESTFDRLQAGQYFNTGQPEDD